MIWLIMVDSRSKGGKGERDVVAILNKALSPVKVSRSHIRASAQKAASDDIGDLVGLKDWVLEVKNIQLSAVSSTLKTAVKKLPSQMAASSSRHGAILFKIDRKGWLVLSAIGPAPDMTIELPTSLEWRGVYALVDAGLVCKIDGLSMFLSSVPSWSARLRSWGLLVQDDRML